MTNAHTITTELVLATQTEVMRELTGPGKIGYEKLSEETGIDDRTVRAHVLGDACANLTKFLRYCLLFGPSFVNRFLALIGMGGAHWLETHQDANEFTLNSKTVGLLKEISDALQDGRVDHQEKARILKEARRLEGELNNYIHAASPQTKGTKK